MNNLGPIIWLLLLAVVFYFLLLRPARVRQRQAQEVQNALRPGLEVMTTAGMYATVRELEDDVVVLEVAPGVLSRFAKGAVARILDPADLADPSGPGTETGGGAGTGPGQPPDDEPRKDGPAGGAGAG